MEPIPEGHWKISDLVWGSQAESEMMEIEKSYNNPVNIPLDYMGPGQTQRSQIDIRVDYNWEFAPGTKGCVNVYNQADFDKLVTWLRDKDLRDLYVEWNLGTCLKPLPMTA